MTSPSPISAHADPALDCRNCGAPLVANARFCAQCGQSAATPHTTTWHIIEDWLEHYVGQDGALWRSLRLLMLYPGELTRRYLIGQRGAFLKPLQIYLLASLVMFGVAKITGFGSADWFSIKGASGSTNLAEIAQELEGSQGLLNSALARKLRAVSGLPPAVFADRAQRHFMQNLPLALFLMVPILAALLKLFWGVRQRYADHLVLALHMQAAGFLWIALFFLLDRIDADLSVAVLVAMLAGSAWIALRTRYPHRGLSFALRALPTALAYALTLTVILGGLTVVSFLNG